MSPSETFRFRKPGFTASAEENTALSFSCAATSSAIMNGALWYCFAPAIAPLHWYSHRSGRFETVTFPSAPS